jgi:hypothetical protein
LVPLKKSTCVNTSRGGVTQRTACFGLNLSALFDNPHGTELIVQAITVRDRDAGVDGVSLTDIPYPRAGQNDVIVRVVAGGLTPGELDWPTTWTDRAGRDRTPSGHELSGVVAELGHLLSKRGQQHDPPLFGKEERDALGLLGQIEPELALRPRRRRLRSGTELHSRII